MSNQCKNCDRDRDLNNNYVGYSNGYMAANTNNNNNRNSSNLMSINNNNNTNTNSNSNNNNATMMQGPKITAKVMFGSLGAIKELREKEHAEKTRSSQAGRRH
ncbi:AAC-rich mRNA clone AAC11 protein [Chironomus tepperi]|uniref:AAC-rich mRNA clone AAC11 protein n=1 Tax=Chironomus tepperi TaxID=113505 RepID=UPI00391EF1F4